MAFARCEEGGFACVTFATPLLLEAPVFSGRIYVTA